MGTVVSVRGTKGMAGAMMPMVRIVWHGAKPSPKRGPPVKGFNGLFNGFPTV